MTTSLPATEACVQPANRYLNYVRLLLQKLINRKPATNMPGYGELQSKVLVCIGTFGSHHLFTLHRSIGPLGKLVCVTPDLGNAIQLHHLAKTLGWDNVTIAKLQVAAGDQFVLNSYIASSRDAKGAGNRLWRSKGNG